MRKEQLEQILKETGDVHRPIPICDEDTAEYRIARKPCRKRSVIDDCERLDAWRAVTYRVSAAVGTDYDADDPKENLARLSLSDKYASLIIPAAANIANIFLMRQFFINFPRDVEEAAEIDGLNRYGVFFRIAMPLARPTIATTAIFGFMGFWNAFTAPMLYLKTPAKYTLTLGLQAFKSHNGGTMWNEVMAAACISVLPIIVIYLIFNRFFLVGLRMDGEK